MKAQDYARRDYALIGNCETAALVSPAASIDWLCWPNFDSPPCFNALTGGTGFWRIAPEARDARFSRLYRGPTPILETEIATATGKARITDFMPTKIRDSHVVRRIEGLAGEVALTSEIAIAFADGARKPYVRRHGDNSLHFIAGPDRAVLRTVLVHEPQDNIWRGTFTIAAGATLDFSLTYNPSYADAPRLLDPAIVLDQTERTWRAWTSRCTYEGPYADQVMRALICLRASLFQPSGGIVGTIGPSPNHRLCRLESAHLAMRALLDTGYDIEAKLWRNFLLRAIGGNAGDLRSAYEMTGVAQGEPALLDIYGAVVIALCESRARGLNIDPEDWAFECALLDEMERRLAAEKTTAFDRTEIAIARRAYEQAIGNSETFSLAAPCTRWQTRADELAVKSKEMNDSPRDDSSSLTQGFAKVVALAEAQKRDEATKLFEELCMNRNALGLLAEGNNGADNSVFPDTAAHIGLINAAYALIQVTNA